MVAFLILEVYILVNPEIILKGPLDLPDRSPSKDLTDSLVEYL